MPKPSQGVSRIREATRQRRRQATTGPGVPGVRDRPVAAASRPARPRGPSFRLLFASNPLPMWVFDLETLAFLEVNDAAIARYGYGRDEFLAMRITDIRPPEDVPALLEHLASGRPELHDSGHWRHRTKAGEVIDVEIASHTLTFRGRRAVLVVAQDVTARVRAERALAESEARKRALFDAALDAIVTIDDRGLVTELNPAATELFGYSPDELLGRPIVETIIPHEFRDRHRVAFERYLATGEATILGRRVRLRALHADGHEFPVELTVYRVPLPGPPTFSAFVRDLSEATRLEEQLLQAQKMESIGRLAGGIAHDFNNLLTAISGYSSLALRAPDMSPEVREDLEQIRVAARKATELTAQLLAFSRRQVLQPEPLNLGAKVAELEPMFRRLLREDIRVATMIDPRVGHVLVDPGQITQVIMNLVVNAGDAMPEGGTLTLEVANVELDAEYAQGHPEVAPGPYVVLSVSDTGIGMDEATRARIFEPFFTTKPKGEGTGLGLATTYGIVKQSGGHIWVYSEPGRGSVFKIYLPRVEAVSGRRLAPAPRSAQSTGTETILVVEDDEGVRAFVRTVLERHGYRVLAARGPDQAIELAAGHHGPIDLLITDVVMPGGSGPDLAHRIRELKPDLKVLFVSGYTENTIVHRGVLDPGVSFLAKPFSPEELAARVRRELDAADT